MPDRFPSRQAPEAEVPIFDRVGLLAWLEGDEEIAQIITATFLEETPRQIAALRGALKQGDAPTAERQAHTIKGAAATISGGRVRQVAAQIERAAGVGDLRSATRLVAELEAQFDRLQAAI